MVMTIAFVVGAGLFAAREVRSAEGYSLGGRSAGAAMVAGSIAGTVVGGGATVGTAQMAFNVGLPAWWFTLGSGISFLIMGFFYAAPLRRAGLTTIPEYLSLNYGKAAGSIASVVSSMGILFSAVASCLPGIGIIAAVLGIGAWPAAAVLMTLVALYTFFGGMKSAGIGGILKMGIIWVSLFFAGITAWQLMPSEPAFSEIFPAVPWQSLLGRGIGSAMANLVSLIVGILCTQTYIQAVFSATSPRVAAVGAFVSALIVIPVGLPSVAIGMYMRYAAPETIPVLVLPVYLAEHLPAWMGGIALGGIALSLISSIGGLSLGIGTMVSHDLIARILDVKEEKRLLLLTRGVVLGVMTLACLISILNRDSEVLMWNYLSMALRGAGIFLPLSAAVFLPGRISPRWVIASMALSTVAAVLFSTVWKAPIAPLFIGLILSGVLMLFGIRRPDGGCGRTSDDKRPI